MVVVFSADLHFRKTINQVCSAFTKQTQIANLHTLSATTMISIPVSKDIPICSQGKDPIGFKFVALPRSGLLTIFDMLVSGANPLTLGPKIVWSRQTSGTK
jgi:hypothetical protein